MNKYANLIAHSWEEYSAQGPAFKTLQDWWESNWRTIDGATGPQYNSWTNWYMRKYYDEWGKVHRGPEETLRVLQQESGTPKADPMGIAPTPRKQKRQERRKKLTNIFNGGLGRGSLPKAKPGVNLKELSPDTQEFLKTLTSVAQKLGAETPFVTSGYRSPSSQARVMSNNWKKRGGNKPLNQEELRLLGPALTSALKRGLDGRPITKGAVYLYKLYQIKELAFFVNNALHDYGVNRESRRIIAEWIDGNVPKTSHMAKPATSVDLRLTQNIKKVLDTVKESGEFDFKTLYEGDHYHIRVQNRNTVA